jgi:hypothetical protein
MKGDHDIALCACGTCSRPIKLIDGVPKLGAPPELFVFYCRACESVERSGKIDNVPSMWR